MLSFATSYNLRIVTVNQRDYPGSTPYTPSELDLLASPNVEDQELALRAQAQEIAAFLVHLTKSTDIQPVRETNGRRIGGLVLLGWSLGNFIPLSLFGNAEHLDVETRTLLEIYLRSLVVFDTPPFPIGEPPLEDPNVSASHQTKHADEGRSPDLVALFSAYYSLVPDLFTMDAAALMCRDRVDEPSGTQFVKPTIAELTVAELQSIADFGVMTRSGIPLMGIKPDVYRRVADRALFDTRGLFSNVNTLVIWCDMSPSMCIWSARRIAERAEEGVTAGGKLPRNITIVKMKGANHFVPWDEPEYMVQFLAKNI
ncbi:hypothetical protein PHLCEN_2v12422 [Hermanssonia centrifuga]|uniref:AB hydrolase-1 domain-containing protein n=1 Tax=Hermanssonia centrifuga TaxID=98765 RepID=A0A2R6NHJ3_9APHY|nr:hypothetical protein PHLCEN_2v12422 [Hermanssonia centrifuga]